MPDIVPPHKRSEMMSGIRGRDTKPELEVRRYLHALGLRYRLHVADLPGRPDIVFPRHGAVVFVHGCFWHRHPGCRFAYQPKSNEEFWTSKFAKNIERDKRDALALTAMGWRVFVAWECETDDLRLADLSEQIRAVTDRSGSPAWELSVPGSRGASAAKIAPVDSPLRRFPGKRRSKAAPVATHPRPTRA
jgi:DNA mismatch endonuclease (patch repair protein)